jgi:hypothetical protein
MGKASTNGTGMHANGSHALASQRSPLGAIRAPPAAAPTATEPNAGSIYTYPSLGNHVIRRIAVEAACDPRCVVKYLRGMAQRSTMRARIEEALSRTGYAHLIGWAHKTAAQRAAAELEARSAGRLPAR